MYATLFASAALLTLVNAHGITQQITHDDQTITSPLIGSSSPPGAFWLVSDNGPVTDVTSDQMLCGRVAQKSTSSLSVPAGSTLEYLWSSGYSPTDTLWPHNTGPMFFYMAKCDGDCNNINGQTQFFKLAQFGFESTGVWQQADLHAGKTLPFTVPQDLEPGDYVIRAEIINLAIANPELFPSCATVTVTGSGTESLSGQSATFPGAYSASDPGLTVSGSAVYTDIHDDAEYTFPGPELSGLASSSSPSSSNSGDSSSPSPSASPVGLLGAGSDPATATDSSSATPTDTSPSSTPDTSPSSSTGTDTGSTGNSSSGTVSTDSCAAAWTQCNAQYTGSAADQANYHCATDYTACVAKAMSNNNARRMHRRRRALFDLTSH